MLALAVTARQPEPPDYDSVRATTVVMCRGREEAGM
jgi:hypothetical protein